MEQWNNGFRRTLRSFFNHTRACKIQAGTIIEILDPC